MRPYVIVVSNNNIKWNNPLATVLLGGGGGGNLCRSLDKFNQEPQHVQDEAKDACSDVDSKYYHNNCDHVCIEKKCSFLAGDICKGYTWNKYVNKG